MPKPRNVKGDYLRLFAVWIVSTLLLKLFQLCAWGARLKDTLASLLDALTALLIVLIYLALHLTPFALAVLAAYFIWRSL